MKRHMLLLLLAAISILSCNKEGEIYYREGSVESEGVASTRALQSGSDPFAIDAMQRVVGLVWFCDILY